MLIFKLCCQLRCAIEAGFVLASQAFELMVQAHLEPLSCGLINEVHIDDLLVAIHGQFEFGIQVEHFVRGVQVG